MELPDTPPDDFLPAQHLSFFLFQWSLYDKELPLDYNIGHFCTVTWQLALGLDFSPLPEVKDWDKPREDCEAKGSMKPRLHDAAWKQNKKDAKIQIALPTCLNMALFRMS